MRVVASAAAAEFIRRRGGQLFVWPTRHRSSRLDLTVLHASTNPPERALEFRRIEAGGFLLFLHPGIRRLPDELDVELRGSRRQHVEVYWEGLAYLT